MLTPPVRVCFVCSGNICRSPTAEVVLNELAAGSSRAGLARADSAGTGSWHVGDDMDDRSRRTLAGAGYRVPVHVARQFRAADFAAYDLVVALDSGHREDLSNLAAEADEPDEARAKIVLLRAFDPALAAGEEPDVADPYYGGRGGFTRVLEQVERSCAALLDGIERAIAAGAATPVQQTDSPSR